MHWPSRLIVTVVVISAALRFRWLIVIALLFVAADIIVVAALTMGN